MDASGSRRRNEEAEDSGPTKRHRPQSADILKLHIGCLEEVFDYLSVKDLVSVGQTCKRLNRVVGYIIGQKYPNTQLIPVRIHDDDVYMETARMDDVAQYFGKIFIMSNDLFESFLSAQSNFRRLKTIFLDFVRINVSKSERMKAVLGRVEWLSLSNCICPQGLHASVLAFCSNLKKLTATDPFDKTWLKQKYSTLEAVSFPDEIAIHKMIQFLKLNPNIQDIELSNIRNLLKHRKLVFRSKLKLNVLEFKNLHISDSDNLDAMVQFLNELYRRKFYKKLYLDWLDILNEQLAVIFSSLETLKSISVFNFTGYTSSTANHTVEQLRIENGVITVDDAIALATDLTNLNKVSLNIGMRTSFDIIMPFLRQSRKLTEVEMCYHGDGVHFNKDTGIIDLPAVNRERATSPGAEKVTLYVGERVYLATKWAWGGTDFKFIGLKPAIPHIPIYWSSSLTDKHI